MKSIKSINGKMTFRCLNGEEWVLEEIFNLINESDSVELISRSGINQDKKQDGWSLVTMELSVKNTKE